MPRSKYYYKPRKDKLKNELILDKIKGIATAFPSYGYRRITAHLRREGVIINHKRVYRIMSQIYLFSIKLQIQLQTYQPFRLKVYYFLVKK